MPRSPDSYRPPGLPERQRRTEDSQRPNAHQRGYNRRWAKARKTFLARHPLCAACHAVGQVREATVVDHIVPHRGNQALFWNTSNWQPLCERCHNVKTAKGQ